MLGLEQSKQAYSAEKRDLFHLGQHPLGGQSNGIRQVIIRINGSQQVGRDVRDAVSVGGFANDMPVTALWHMEEGDYAELVVYHNLSGNQDVLRVSSFSPEFGIVGVGS